MLPETVWFLRASIFALVGIVFLVWSLYNVPILYKLKFECVNSSYMRSKSSFKTELYLRVIKLCKLDCSLYLSGSCRSHPKRNWKQYIFFWGGGGKQSTRRCANNKSMKLILFSPSHCFIVLLPKNWHNSKTYFNLKSGIKVIRRLSLRLPLQWFI